MNHDNTGKSAFGNAGTSRPAGRAQRVADHSGHADDMVQLNKIPRPKIRRRRPGPFNPKPKNNRA